MLEFAWWVPPCWNSFGGWGFSLFFFFILGLQGGEAGRWAHLAFSGFGVRGGWGVRFMVVGPVDR